MNCKNHVDAEASGACVYCGELFCSDCLVLLDGKNYCKEHVKNVMQVNSISQETELPQQEEGKKTSWIKIIIGIIILIGLFNSGIARDIFDTVENSVGSITSTDKYVRMVKNNSIEKFEADDATVGKVFESFAGKPEWESFISTNNERVVEFNGIIKKSDKNVKLTVQFLISGESDFQIDNLQVNGETLSILETDALLNKMYDSYVKKKK